MSYLSIIKTACIYFPIIALLVTLPYILREYHKFGSIHLMRAFIVYSFILYLMVAYFLIILPLPAIDTVRGLTTPYMQLIPFNFLYEIVTKVKFDYLFLTHKEVYEVFFNILLTLPFGLYLRYFFKCDMKKTVTYSFLFSLFFELTQLSGLYFIYPRPYRLFDVDDLMLNTLGGYIGYLLTPIITFKLPTRDELDKMAYIKGKKISLLKRLVAYNIDIIMYIIISIIIKLIIDIDFKYIYLIAFILYFAILPIITKGYTLGKRFVNIKITNMNEEIPKWYQYLIRYILCYLFITILFLVILGIPALTVHYYDFLVARLSSEYIVVIVIIYAIIVLMLTVYFVINNLINGELFLYERISRTKNTSTIKIPK